MLKRHISTQVSESIIQITFRNALSRPQKLGYPASLRRYVARTEHVSPRFPVRGIVYRVAEGVPKDVDVLG